MQGSRWTGCTVGRETQAQDGSLSASLLIHQSREQSIVLGTVADPWVFKGSGAQGSEPWKS